MLASSVLWGEVQIGSRVHHRTYGTGVILNIRNDLAQFEFGGEWAISLSIRELREQNEEAKVKNTLEGGSD